MTFASLAARANVTLYRVFGEPATCADVPCVVVLSRASNTGPTGYDAQVSGQSVTAVVRVGEGDGMLPAAPIAGALLVVGTVRGRWTAGGMPGTAPSTDRYLIDVLTDARVARQMLDALGLPLWLIVGCWSWDGAAAAVVTVEPLDTVLYLPHLPGPVDPDTGLPTGAPALLREPHRWAGWPACIGVEP